MLLPLGLIKQTHKRVQDDILNFNKPVIIAPTGSDRKRYYDKNATSIKQQFQTTEGPRQGLLIDN